MAEVRIETPLTALNSKGLKELKAIVDSNEDVAAWVRPALREGLTLRARDLRAAKEQHSEAKQERKVRAEEERRKELAREMAGSAG